MEAFHIIRANPSRSGAVKRIVMRDARANCGILLDDNNRKARLSPVFQRHKQRRSGFSIATKNCESRSVIWMNSTSMLIA